VATGTGDELGDTHT